MAQPLIALLSNPASGYNRRAGLDKLDAAAARAGIAHHKASNVEHIEAALADIARSGPDILALNGGDGTIDLAVRFMRSSGVFQSEPRLALLRGGTTNMIHRDCGLAPRPAKALLLLLSNGGTTVRRPLEIFRDCGTPLYGFFMGTGAMPRAILSTRQTLHKHGATGPIGEMLAFAAILSRLKFRHDLAADPILNPTPLPWSIGETAQESPHIFFAATSLKRLILNIEVPAPEEEAGILFMGEDRRLRKLAGAPVRLETTEPWILDGEIFPPGKLEIRLGAPLTFMTGRVS